MKKDIRNLFLLIVTCIFFTVMISGKAITKVEAAENAYDADAAIKFAKEHCAKDAANGKCTRKSSFEKGNVWKCAEFVANCLQAGNLDINQAMVSSLYSELKNEGYSIGTVKKTACNNGIDHKIKKSDCPNLKKGDVIITYCSKCGLNLGNGYKHAVIYSGENADGYIKCYGHNSLNCATKAYANHCGTCGNSKNVTVFAIYLSGKSSVSSGSKTIFKAQEKDVYIYSRPYYTNSVKKGTVKKGSKVTVKGFMYNANGNLWYITEKGYYIAASYLKYVSGEKAPSDYCSKQMVINVDGKRARSVPYVSGDKKKAYAVGAVVTIKGVVKNNKGDVWYMLSDGTYTYSTGLLDIETCETKLKANLSGLYYRNMPSSDATKKQKIAKGEKFSVKGYVYATNGKIWYVTTDNRFVFAKGLSAVSNTKIPASYIDTTYKIKSKATVSRKAPTESASVVKKYSVGKKVKVCGYMTDSNGRKWYMVSENEYILEQ